AGAIAREELMSQTREFLEGQAISPRVFSHQIAFNCIPHIGGFKDNGCTSEEIKMVAEAQKILGLPDLKVSATAVRVPTLSCHAESVNIECEKPFHLEEVRNALREMPGVIVQDSPAENIYPLGMAHIGDSVEGATGRDAVYVGRIRR